ncbi:MAG: penicillin-binding protein 2, partial [Candidatus Hydrogenedentes bacterium]|nr:penicillin-binding protein 2 [Candidatus Hydrogenedentota bacterium]
MGPRARNASSRRYKLRRPMDRNHRIRFLLVTICTALMFSSVAARLVFLHCFLNKDVITNLLQKQHAIVPIASSRGSVYDRNMHVLATTVQVMSLHAVTKEIKSVRAAASQLAPLLGVPATQIARTLNTKKSFVWIARQLEPSVGDKVKQLHLDGIYLTPEPRRFYPKNKLAAHVLGITGIDGQGLEGLESRYDDILRGEDGHIVVLRDPVGRPLLPLLDERKDPTGGNHLVLTIDEDIQNAAQEALRHACEKYKPERGMAVVENPRTGDILAVANWPEFDPNKFTQYSANTRRNAAFVDVFEPGSAFKIVTATGALEEHLVKPYETINCHNGRLVYCGDTIRDVHAMKEVSFVEVIEKSSNIGTIEVADRMGPELFDQYVHRFGFGQRVGTGFPGEPRGILRPLERWSKRSMGALPIGQEIAVTCMQLAQAFSALANGGTMIRPRLVDRILSNDGSVVSQMDHKAVGSVCSPSVAKMVTEI